MSESPGPGGSTPSSDSLQRGLLVRIAVATAALLALAVFALVVLVPGKTTAQQDDQAPIAGSPPQAVITGAPSVAAEPAPSPAPDAAGAQENAGSTGMVQAAETAAAIASGSVQRPQAKPGGAANSPLDAATEAGSAGGSEDFSAGRTDGVKPPVGPGGAGEEGAKTTRSASAQERKPARGPHLQAGVFLQAANAQALKATLEAQGLPVYIESRVHIGPFRDRKEAERMHEKLKEMGVSTVLVGH